MIPRFLHGDADLDAGLAELVVADPRLRPLIDRAGRPNLRRRPAGFPGLCAIVCAQQLSTASASAIWGRLVAAFDPFHHDAVRRARTAKLARLGLSQPKIRTMKALGAAIAKGEIDLEALAAMVALAQPWRPWRGVAAHVLWNYYRAVKRRDPLPIPANAKPATTRGATNGR